MSIGQLSKLNMGLSGGALECEPVVLPPNTFIPNRVTYSGGQVFVPTLVGSMLLALVSYNSEQLFEPALNGQLSPSLVAYDDGQVFAPEIVAVPPAAIIPNQVNYNSEQLFAPVLNGQLSPVLVTYDGGSIFTPTLSAVVPSTIIPNRVNLSGEQLFAPALIGSIAPALVTFDAGEVFAPTIAVSGGGSPAFFNAADDLDTYEITNAGVGSINLGNYQTSVITTPDLRVVVLGAFDNTGEDADISSITLSGLASSTLQSQAAIASVPGCFAASFRPVSAVNGDIVVNFSTTDVTDVVALAFAFNSDDVGLETGATFDGSPFWRTIFSNGSNLDNLGASMCVVDATDPTITDLVLDFTAAPNAIQLTGIITQNRIRCRFAMHRNEPGFYFHQWGSGASGDDGHLAFFQSQVV